MYQKTRHGIQYFFLGIQIILFLLLITGVIAIAHQFCPYASVCFGILGTHPQLPALLFPAAIIGGLLIALATIFLGRLFCSHVCFFGTVQEMIFMRRSVKYRTKKRVPYYIDKKLMWIKYAVFLGTVVLAITSLSYIYMKFCPVLAISYPKYLTIAGISILVIIFLGTLLTERIWCRYLCPYGAMMNLFQYLGGVLGLKRKMIHRNLEVCTDCGACNRFCPMNIQLTDVEIVRDPNCIHCRICIEKCPKKTALTECGSCQYRKRKI